MNIIEYKNISITFYLPLTFKRGDNSIFLAVINAYESFLKLYYEFWKELAETINPMTIDVSLLDYLALDNSSPWRLFWSTDWNEIAKRNLLRDTKEIFSKRLFPQTLTLLFADFNLKARLVPTSGFILGTINPPASTLPATLGTSLFSYQVVIDKGYLQGGNEYRLIYFLTNNFGFPGRIPIIYET